MIKCSFCGIETKSMESCPDCRKKDDSRTIGAMCSVLGAIAIPLGLLVLMDVGAFVREGEFPGWFMLAMGTAALAYGLPKYVREKLWRNEMIKASMKREG